MLLLALVLDQLGGEPPARLHPVVWMGRLLTWLEAHAPADQRARLAYGLMTGCLMPLAWACLGRLVQRFTPWPVHALALKPTFAGRALLEAGRRVQDGLQAGRLGDARDDLRALVSRPTAQLDSPLVAAGAIESLAENLADSWIAPLIAYAWGGLGAAYAFRAANTADAMWGYRAEEYEWLGKGPARLDDLLGWLPARLSALLLVCAGSRPGPAIAAWRRDAARTASPNAGRPMAVAAGQLGVRLEKPDAYTLNPGAPQPTAHDLAAARRLVGRAMLLGAAVTLVVCGVREHG